VGGKRALVAVLAIVAIATVIVRSELLTDLSVGAVRARVESYGSLAPVAFMGLLMAGFFVAAPAMMLAGIGGAIFGLVPGFLYCWIAAVVGTALPFALVRKAVGRYVQRADGVRFRRLRAIDERLAAHGFATVLALRVVFCMAPPLNWGLGATRVGWRDYLLGTAIGVMPGIGISVYLGDAVTDAGSWRALATPNVVIPGLLVAASFVVGGIAGRRLFGAGVPRR
jgi:phospholipase D1/2